ncbi:uncharacterized protein LOC133497920 isoform X2 [Syngnathoides biaculeatus]|uniref:uncharacterized protein LOC133497920 isoform X2 n=1 Tax=Syngnathoides biaculeatus TaxID=300417 RepID=UPI002ADD3A3B|nr:uncharacterized protein LOC133497920 isoform X2 [Syngnathoides biaculeatus]
MDGQGDGDHNGPNLEAAAAGAESGANQLMGDEEEEDPQLGPSSRCREDEEDEDEMRSSSRYFRWWHEFDNSSDGSSDLENDQQEPAPAAAKKRSRDDLDGNLRLRGDLSLGAPSGPKNPASDERAPKGGDFRFGQQEAAEDALLTCADDKSRENYDRENKSGKKRFKRF